MKLYILTNIIIAAFIISKELRDQLAKDILFNVFYNILDYILNDIVELDPRLTAFYNYIVKLLKLYKISKEDIQKYLDDKSLFNIEKIFYQLFAKYYNLIDIFFF